MSRYLGGLAVLLAAGIACAQSTQDPPAAIVAAEPGAPAMAVPGAAAEAQAQAQAQASATVAGCACIPAGTIVDLEILETLNSAQHKRGDRFRMKLSAPVEIEGATALLAETPAVGEIVHASPGRGGGKPGELLIAARFVDDGERQVPLRGLKLGVSGKSTAGLAFGVAMAAGPLAPFALFIRGREIEIPSGTLVHARLAADVPLAAEPPPAADVSTDVPSIQE